MRSPSSPAPDRLDSSSRSLLERARHGDSNALDELVRRYLPRLRRWTHGRLPRWVRSMADTTDLVHDAWLRTIGRLDALEPRGQHALGSYLREAVRNRIRDEHRRFARRGPGEVLPDTLADAAPSPQDLAVRAQLEERYRAALEDLSPSDRELIVAHVELEYTHEQLACMTGRSRNAARVALQRAVGRLAGRMREG
jgi:RNA polymerase sigma factor (sigma-70 family)